MTGVAPAGRGSRLLATLAAILVRPRLWIVALRQLRVLVPPGWWRRPPFLPLPDRAYLRFRLITAYGEPDRPPEARDVVTYLEWCRDFPSVKPTTSSQGGD